MEYHRLYIIPGNPLNRPVASTPLLICCNLTEEQREYSSSIDLDIRLMCESKEGSLLASSIVDVAINSKASAIRNYNTKLADLYNNTSIWPHVTLKSVDIFLSRIEMP